MDPQQRWRAGVAMHGISTAAGETHTLRLTLTSRRIYRRGCNGISAETAAYWHKGDRWQYVEDEAYLPGRVGGYEVEYADDDPSPEELHEAEGDLSDRSRELLEASDWEDLVDVEGCEPNALRLEIALDDKIISRGAGLERLAETFGFTVEHEDDGPLYEADTGDVNMEIKARDKETFLPVHPTRDSNEASEIKTLVEACCEESDCCWCGSWSTDDIAGLDPSALTFHVVDWHGSDSLSEYPSELLVRVTYNGQPLEGDGQWSSDGGHQGGSACLVAVP